MNNEEITFNTNDILKETISEETKNEIKEKSIQARADLLKQGLMVEFEDTDKHFKEEGQAYIHVLNKETGEIEIYKDDSED